MNLSRVSKAAVDQLSGKRIDSVDLYQPVKKRKRIKRKLRLRSNFEIYDPKVHLYPLSIELTIIIVGQTDEFHKWRDNGGDKIRFRNRKHSRNPRASVSSFPVIDQHRLCCRFASSLY